MFTFDAGGSVNRQTQDKYRWCYLMTELITLVVTWLIMDATRVEVKLVTKPSKLMWNVYSRPIETCRNNTWQSISGVRRCASAALIKQRSSDQNNSKSEPPFVIIDYILPWNIYIHTHINGREYNWGLGLFAAILFIPIVHQWEACLDSLP